MDIKKFNEFHGSEKYEDDFSKENMISQILKYNSKFKKEDLDKLTIDEIVSILQKELNIQLDKEMNLDDLDDMYPVDETYNPDMIDKIKYDYMEGNLLDIAQGWCDDREENPEPLNSKEKRKIHEFAIYLERFYKMEKLR